MARKYETVFEYVDDPESGGQGRYYPGLPARTMTLDEWDAATGDKALALADGAYREGRREKAVEPEPEPAMASAEPPPAPQPTVEPAEAAKGEK